MKKMMYNDKYDLTQAVIEGRKTVTRRIAKPWKGAISFANCLKRLKDAEYEDEDGNPFIPPYHVGEVVAVAQCYSDIWQGGEDCRKYGKSTHPAAWNNKMFVKASLMPHQIKILSIRPERLQDISEDDCLLEGVFVFDFGFGACYGFEGVKKEHETAMSAFIELIDRICGKGTWEANPWVWRIEFELIKTK